MNKKTARLEIRMTEDEKADLQKIADRLGLTLSEYARQKIINNRVIILTDEEKRNITGIGRNFNQLLRFANSRERVPPGIEEELKAIIKDLKKYYY